MTKPNKRAKGVEREGAVMSAGKFLILLYGFGIMLLFASVGIMHVYHQTFAVVLLMCSSAGVFMIAIDGLQAQKEEGR